MKTPSALDAMAASMFSAVVADTLTRAERSERMSRVRSHGTKPERMLCTILAALGYRYRFGHSYRRNGAALPGRPDVVLPSLRCAVFVHGCFWHRHPSARCALARMPKSRVEFWGPKLDGNRQRDLLVLRRLRALGWRPFVVWECELRDPGGRPRDVEKLTSKLARFLEAA